MRRLLSIPVTIELDDDNRKTVIIASGAFAMVVFKLDKKCYDIDALVRVVERVWRVVDNPEALQFLVNEHIKDGGQRLRNRDELLLEMCKVGD